MQSRCWRRTGEAKSSIVSYSNTRCPARTHIDTPTFHAGAHLGLHGDMTSSLLSPSTLYHAGNDHFFRGRREEEGVKTFRTLDAWRRSSESRVALTTAAAGISGTLGSVSVRDARELLSALLTAPDHSSSLAGMSTCANRAPGGLREVHFSLLLYVSVYCCTYIAATPILPSFFQTTLMRLVQNIRHESAHGS